MASRLLILLGALLAIAHTTAAVSSDKPQAAALENGPLHVYRDASGKLVEEPESLPAQDAAQVTADLAKEIDALYYSDVAVRTTKVRPINRKTLQPAVVAAQQGSQKAASVRPSGTQKRVVSFNGV